MAGWPAWCAALLVLALPLALLTWKAWQRRQARDGAALVDPALLAQPALRLGLTAGLALHGVVPAYLLVMTFVVQGGLHASPEQMALLCVPIAAGAAFGIAVLSQRVVPRWGTASVAVGAAVQAAALVLRNRGSGPFGILGLVDERCGGVFDNIDDGIPAAEREAFMARYKAAAGFAIETLNAAPPIIAPGARVAGEG